MSVYAVYDTNVIVSALLSRNANAATVKVLDACLEKQQLFLYIMMTSLRSTERCFFARNFTFQSHW